MIEINDYKIDSDKHQFILIEKTQGKNPKTGEDTEGERKSFHSNFNQCLKAIADREIKNISCKGLDSLESQIDRIITKLNSISSK